MSLLEQLKLDIINGHFKPGHKLLMSDLKARYGVGISPLREALSQLVVQKFVTVENQKGFKVKPISLLELQDIYETRAHIEKLCIELAISKGGDDWEAGIVAAAHSLFKLESADDKQIDIEQWQQRHSAFHDAIVAGCGLAELLDARRSLYDKAERYRSLWLRETMATNQLLEKNHDDHQLLMDAVINRKVALATNMITEHLMVPVAVIKKALEERAIL